MAARARRYLGGTAATRRRHGPIGQAAALAVLAVLVAVLAGGCGSESSAAPGLIDAARPSSRQPSGSGARRAKVASAKPVSSAPLVSAPGALGPSWRPVATVAGQPAAWIAQRAGTTLMRFDQRAVHLALHAGTAEPSGSGWVDAGQIGRREIHRVLAAFNGGFKLSYGSVGFMANGRVGVPLASGLGSIVTYSDHSTQIGAWHAGVPARASKIVSVLQNLGLLVDHGVPARTVEGCATACWGSTLGGGTDVPRSALGITGEGQLVWAAGTSLSPAALARALVSAGVQRAVELDINPQWVAGYLYVHRPGGPAAVPVVPGQHGIAGELLAPYSRDFFTILAN